ncbi:DUF6790 family protein [Variovorax sp. Sphag1AA]|uniref:DUF6790 family protein n=1 Tax=Variovorax sp. Sphag1AA TaxID=2587027 RepID=UPI001618ADD7|nr:DUF6790 family protein [Variovorax sp. Sphag1AA]MBB3178750.1 hypothetical protein [Variovorax sp. Sphag1AA]
MADFIRATIHFVLANYPLTFLVIGFLVSAAAIARQHRPWVRADIVEALLRWFVFFSVGIYNFYNFVMHVFFGALSAQFIGWADSPFQLEVGMASLGFSAVGLLAAFRSFDMRLAAILGPSIFTLGAAVGHLREMVTAHNFAPGNAGLMFYADIFVPMAGFALLWASRPPTYHAEPVPLILR